MSFEHSKEIKDAANVLRPHTHVPHVQAYALSAAGLLRTESDRLNAELAEAMVAYTRKYGMVGNVALCNQSPERDRVWAALRAILDARKPRWSVEVAASGGPCWIYCDGKNTSKTFPADAEPEARAYVARKNAEGAK